jgi:hypothetical protein
MHTFVVISCTIMFTNRQYDLHPNADALHLVIFQATRIPPYEEFRDII